MTDPQLQATLDSLRASFAERVGARGRTFAAAVRKAGRRVPRKLRPAAAALIEAERMAANPRLARLVDAGQVELAARDLEIWLATQDPRERRKTAIINWAALIGFYVLVTAGLVIAFLVWRGYV